MALIGPMKYLTIGNKTYEIESGGSTDIYWVTYGTDINKTELESAIADGKLVVLTRTEKDVFAVLQQYYDEYAVFSNVGSLSGGMSMLVATADISSSTTEWNDFSYGLEADVFFVDLSSNTLDWSDLVNAKNSDKVIVGYRGTVNNTEYYTFVKYYYNSGTYNLTFVGNPATSGGEYVSFYYGSGSGTSVTWTTSDYNYSANAPFYGTCSTTASTAQKEVTANGFKFYIGSILGVNFSTANTAATPTLRLNGTGNAHPIYVGNSTPNATDNVLKWSANTTVYFMWIGSHFKYITSVSAGTVEPSRGANTWYGTSPTAAATQAKTSTINNFVLTKGSLASIKFTYANTYTSNKITLNINSTGAKDIYYNGTVTSSTNTLLWNAGEVLTFMYDGTGYQYIGKSVQKVSQLTNDSGYTSNTGTVTSVGLSNATNGGLSVSGSPVTSSGTISVGHSNVLANAQTTQAVYPITIDKNGHIASYGDAYVPSGSTYIVNTSEQVNWPEVVEAYNQGKVIIAQHSYPYQNPRFYNLVDLFYDDPQNPSVDDYMVFTVAQPQLDTINNLQFKSGRIDYLMWNGADGTWDQGSTQLVSSYDGVVNSDLTFMAQGNTGGATPALRFQRVLLTDNRTDWQMYGDDSNNIVFQQKTGNNAWTTEATLTPSGNLTVPSVSLTTGTISTTPSSSTDIVNKSYVDNAMTVVTLNGTTTSSASFYAPTSAGTSNYFLKSSGSGAPTWSQPIKYGSTLPASGDFTGQVFILTE